MIFCAKLAKRETVCNRRGAITACHWRGKTHHEACNLSKLYCEKPAAGFGGRYFYFCHPDNFLRHHRHWRNLCRQPFEIITAMASDMLQRYLEGQNPFQIEQFCRRAHGSGFSHRPDPSLHGVVSGLEMACWDIMGKTLDRPVYDLLGGQVHDRLRTYTYLYPRADQDARQF